MSTKKIVVGYDGSQDARAAADWAADEAARIGAPVEFVYAFDWPFSVPIGAMVPGPVVWPDEQTRRDADQMLKDGIADATRRRPDLVVTRKIVQAPATLTLCDRSAEAGLVVLGSRGHSAVAGLLGSVSVGVSAHAHCPVIVVRGADDPSAPVVVGVDQSDRAPIALGFAFEYAAGRGVPLRVIRAWTPPANNWEGPSLDLQTVATAERAAVAGLVATWWEQFPPVAVTIEVAIDHPARALTEAGGSAQLVVVGSRGRGTFRGMLLGSVSQHLLHHCACNVAVVREHAAH